MKSISNIGKNLPGKISIGRLSLSGTGINLPVLCLDGVTSIASAGEISSIAASGLVLCKMTSNSGSGGNSNSSSDENIDVNNTKGVSNPSLTEPSLSKGGELTEEEIEMLTSKETSKGHQAELDTAKLLKKEGYDIKPLKEGDVGNGYGLSDKSNPDYLIEGEPFDCYAPESKNPKTVVKEISKKNKEQTERITLNLDNYQGDIEELKDMILRKTNGDLKNLKELLVVKDGEITRWFARGE